MNQLFRTLLFLPEQASSIASRIDHLHYVVISITMVGAFAFAAAIGWFNWRYREGAHRGRSRKPDEREGHTRGGISYKAEFVIWGGLLVLFFAFWVVGFRQYVTARTPPKNAMQIYVTGKQWMWTFAYPDGRGSKGVVYVPVKKPIELVMTSRDVIHSFFVPAFRLKQDVVPGRTTTLWFEVKEPGVYQVLCAEYCGTNHSHMRAEVVALSPADYAKYLDSSPPPSSEGKGETMAERGERLANKYGCFRCHTTDGTPHIGPTWAGDFGTRVLLKSGKKVEVDAAYITRSIMDPMVQVRAGFKPVMPTYQGLISSGEVGAIVEYIRSLQKPPPPGGTEPLPRGPLKVERPPGSAARKGGSQ